MLVHLNDVNDIEVKNVKSDAFNTFGNVIEGFDFSEMIKYMEENTQIPDAGNLYVASEKHLEEFKVAQIVQNTIYGGMPIQVGYCNGKNSTYNGFEYHKCSEVLVALTNCVLVLGHLWDMKNNEYQSEDAQLFYVEKGTVIELYQTTLHLSPCRVEDAGYKTIIILAKGTNDTTWKDRSEEEKVKITKEDELLLYKNKWVIAHKDREPLVKSGAYIGLIGENKEVKY